MPTYRNITSNMVYILDYSFRPGIETETSYYINLNDYPELVKTSDLPEITRPFKTVLTSISTNNDNMSMQYKFLNSFILKIEDGDGSPADGNNVDVTILAGYSDNQIEMVPLGFPIRFTRFTITDQNGDAASYWRVTNVTGYRDDSLILNIRNPYTFYSLSVTAITIAGGASINVLTKDIK